MVLCKGMTKQNEKWGKTIVRKFRKEQVSKGGLSPDKFVVCFVSPFSNVKEVLCHFKGSTKYWI